MEEGSENGKYNKYSSDARGNRNGKVNIPEVSPPAQRFNRNQLIPAAKRENLVNFFI